MSEMLYYYLLTVFMWLVWLGLNFWDGVNSSEENKGKRKRKGKRWMGSVQKMSSKEDGIYVCTV